MAIWENYVLPFLTMFVALFLGFGLAFLIYMFFKKVFPNYRWWFKYSIFRFSYNETDVAFLMKVMEVSKDQATAEKLIMLDGNCKSVNEAKELIYIYKKMLKGGR